MISSKEAAPLPFDLLADPAVLLPFVLIGFAAQLVDGALGMAFGTISTTLLVAFGVPPAVASAGVHAVETATTGVSGLSHLYHRNIDPRLFWRLLVPGLIGGVAGAYFLAGIDAEVARPMVLTYLALLGLTLFWKGLSGQRPQRQPKVVEPLGLAGGFLDAAGGGGWGPVVTSNLLVQGSTPRTTIGTVNAVEFFLTVAISIAFISELGWEVITTAVIGLLIGGVVAAPFGALAAKRFRADHILLLVGTVLVATSGYGLYQLLA